MMAIPQQLDRVKPEQRPIKRASGGVLTRLGAGNGQRRQTCVLSWQTPLVCCRSARYNKKPSLAPHGPCLAGFRHEAGELRLAVLAHRPFFFVTAPPPFCESEAVLFSDALLGASHLESGYEHKS